jgi:cupin fold WbuC family metalloprotein
MLIDDKLLDTVSEQAKASPRLRKNYNLHESWDDKVQRMFNAMEPGTKFQIHRHQNTSASTFVIRGRVDVLFWNDDKEVIARYKLDPKNWVYGVNIPKNTWHSLEVLEPSVIFEVKDGPYRPLGEEDILK